MIRAVFKPTDMELVPRIGRPQGDGGSLSTAIASGTSNRNGLENLRFVERVLAPPATIGVTSVENGDWPPENSCAFTIPWFNAAIIAEGDCSGQMLAGVINPEGAQPAVGVGSRLPGRLGERRGIGARGHTVVRHAVDATLLGVATADVGDGAGMATQDAGAVGADFA